jgi:polar amino acid transport system substrate-binding protein
MKFNKLRSLVAGTALALLGGVLATGALSAPANAGTLDEIKANGVLRVGAGVYPPFMIRKPDGSYVGVDVELLGEMAKDLGVKLELVDTGWDTIVAGIVTKKWDVVSGICATPKRAEVIDFSDPYLKVGGVLGVLPSNDKIKKLDDANQSGVLIADIAGSWNEEISKSAFPKAEHKAFSQITQTDLVQELLAGRADAAVFDAPVTSSDIENKFGVGKIKFLPSTTQVMDILPCQLSYGIFKGDTAMRDYVNAFFAKKKSSGELDKLIATWMKPAS